MRPHAFHLRGRPEPIPVGKIVGVGRNFADHAREMGADPREAAPLVLFLKPPTSLRPGSGPLAVPAGLGAVHHEVELVVAVGDWLRHAEEAGAARSILGYGVGLDLTLRDVQNDAKRRGEPWSVAKGFDRSAPVSAFVPPAEADGLLARTIRLTVNGEVRQASSLSAMIRTPARLLAEISRYFTLEPGDLVFTGTPAGVGPLRAGDRVHAEIEGLAALDLTIEDESV